MAINTLRSKILIVLMSVSLLTFIIAIFGIIGVDYVARTANETINARMPLMKCSKQAQIAVFSESSNIYQILLIKTYESVRQPLPPGL